jgi:hypothetical protein
MGRAKSMPGLIPKSGFIIFEPRNNKIVFSWQCEDYVVAKLNPDGTIRPLETVLCANCHKKLHHAHLNRG